MAKAPTGDTAAKAARASKADGGRAARKAAAQEEKAAKAEAKAEAARAKVPFPKKNQRPSEAEFLARLPLAAGKRFEAVRTFLRKQPGITEDLYFYGPKTGWAYRYMRGAASVATVTIHDERLVGIVALDAAALGEVDFTALSDVGERARRLAHGSPSLSWLDLPLDGPGSSDFKVLLKAKLRTMPETADEEETTIPDAVVPGMDAQPTIPPPPPRARRARDG